MVTIAIYIVVALAIFVVGYFVGSNNPLPIKTLPIFHL